jgi:hypothetical protein
MTQYRRKHAARNEPFREPVKLEEHEIGEEDGDEDSALRQSVSDGYDADAGPLETGYASETVALADMMDAAARDEETLSIEPEDLGRRALQDAAQQGEPASGAVRTSLDWSTQDTGTNADGIEPSAVDLTTNAIREGSLFDQSREGEETKLRHPLVKVNEVDETLEHNQRARRATAKGPASKLDGTARTRRH